MQVTPAESAVDDVVVRAVPAEKGQPDDHIVRNRSRNQGVEASRGHTVGCVECEQHAESVSAHARHCVDGCCLVRAGSDHLRTTRDDRGPGGVLDMVADELDGS